TRVTLQFSPGLPQNLGIPTQPNFCASFGHAPIHREYSKFRKGRNYLAKQTGGSSIRPGPGHYAYVAVHEEVRHLVQALEVPQSPTRCLLGAKCSEGAVDRCRLDECQGCI